MKTIRTPAMRSSAFCLLASVFCLLAPAALRAADVEWDTGIVGDWSTPGNWQGGVPPASGDSIFINSGQATITTDIIVGVPGVSTDSGTTALGQSVGQSGTLIIAGGGRLVTSNTFFSVGEAGNGYLEIQDGGVLQTGGYIYANRIGRLNGSSGTVVIQDGGLWESYGGVYVGGGNGGNGFLHVEAGGTLTISAGASLYIGEYATGSGTAIIDGYYYGAAYTPVGKNSTTATELIVGPTGTVSALQLDIGINANSVGKVTIAGYYEARSGATYIGHNDNAYGILIVKSDGHLEVNSNMHPGYGTNSRYYIEVEEHGVINFNTGYFYGATGSGNASGTTIIAGAILNPSTFYVGNYSTGTNVLIITPTGTLTNNANSWAGRNAPPVGVNGLADITVDGYWRTDGYTRLAYLGSTIFSVGTTGIHETQWFDVAAGANTSGTVLIDGRLSLSSTLILAAGANSNVYFEIGTTGSVTAPDITYLANNASGTAFMSVSGLLDAGNLVLGNTGRGTLVMESGGHTRVNGNATIASGAASSGTLILNGGVFETRQLTRGNGAAAILLNGGTLRAGANTDNFIANLPVFDLGSSTLPIDTQSYTVTATNALAGTAAASLDKLGAGVLVLTADSSAYAGTINVLAGSLAGGGANAKLGGTVNVHGGAVLDLRPAPLTINGDLFLDNDARWRYSMTDTHALDVLGNITIGGAGRFILDLGNYSVTDILGSYDVASYATISGGSNLASWAVTGPGLIFDATLDALTTPGIITLNITAGDTDLLHWQGGPGTWDSTTLAWQRLGTGPLIEWNPGAYGVFATGAGTVDVIGDQEVTGLEFHNDGYTIEGTGALFSDQTLNINTYTTSATATINTTITAPGFSKTGAGTLILGGTATFSGNATVDLGLLDIASGGVMRVSGTSILGGNSGYESALNVAGLYDATSNVVIGQGGTGVVTVAAGGTMISRATTYLGSQDGGVGIVTIAGVYDSIGNFSVGQVAGGVGSLTIQNGGTLHTRGAAGSYLGNQAGAQGSAVIETGGVWNAPNLVFVGGAGTGDLTIRDGGRLTQNAAFFAVGYSGTGTLTIDEGGSLIRSRPSTGTYDNFLIGGDLTATHTDANAAYSDATGTVIVNGLLSTPGYLHIGNGGHGYLHLGSSGTIISEGIRVTYGDWNATANVVVDGLWINNGYLIVAHYGDSYMRISGSGVLNATDYVSIGQGDGTGNPLIHSGTLVVEGLLTTQSYVRSGNRLNAVLDITQSGTVIAATYGELGLAATSSGTAIVAGYLQVGTDFRNGSSGRGVLDIKTTGTVLVGTNYAQTSFSALTVSIDPARTTPYLTVTNTASLAGTINVSGLPAVGQYARASDIHQFDSYLLMRAGGGFTGNFDRGNNFGASTPSYIGVSGFIENGTDYRVGYKFIGVFDLDEGETFDLDIPLVTQPAAFGWDGNSLIKSGPGTLIISATNTYTGLTRVNEGMVQFVTDGDITLGTLMHYGTIDLNAASTITGHRTLTVSQISGAGEFLMTVNPAARTSDQIIVNGAAAGAYNLLFDIVGDPFYEIEPLTLVTVRGKNGASYNGGFDIGPRTYAVKKLDDGTVVLAIDGLSIASESILGMATSQNMMWGGQRSNLGRRFGELLLPGLKGERGGLWVRGFTERASIDADDERRGYDSDLFGLTVGADLELKSLEGTRDIVGLFAGSGYAKQNFRRIRDLGTGDGKSTMMAVGAYAMRMLDTGWYVNITAAYMTFKNEFTVADRSAKISTGKYDSEAMNFAIETGRRLSLKDGWFVEPSAQVSYNYTLGSFYETTGSIRNVSVLPASVWQGRAGLQLGRVCALSNGGALQVHGRINGVYEHSVGGDVQIEDVIRRPNLDGAAAEAGAGLAWRISPANQVYADYEAAYGQNYKKPWSFSVGFRHNW